MSIEQQSTLLDSKLIVQTTKGKVLGTELTSEYTGIEYYAFLGIPYAKPPINNLRFLPPEPIDKWVGVRKATVEGNVCYQRSGPKRDTIIGDEDCLYLNVFTSKLPSDIQKSKAVIVQIHAGGHGWGSASPKAFGSPDFFIHQDVILVNFNYRLHVFGFLNLELPNCLGNMGMKDQVMAMKWVKENIKFFGGDPDNITLYGNSSGASDVHLHIISPLSKGLFNKTIRQGGYALNTLFGYQTDHIKRAYDLAELLGLEEKNARRLLRLLKKVTALELVTAVSELAYKLKKVVASRPYHGIFHPTIEIHKEGAFLSQSPLKLMYNPEIVPMPSICGFTEGEGLLAFTGKPWKTQLSTIIKDNLWMYKMNINTIQMITEKVKLFYFNNEDLTEEASPKIVQLFSDLWHIEWDEMINFESSRPGSCPVYVYYFRFLGILCHLRKYFLKNVKYIPDIPGHGDDSEYFLCYKYLHKLSEINVSTLQSIKHEKKVIDSLTTLFTTFAKTGNPNNDTLTDEINWQSYHPDNPSYLEFNKNLTIKAGVVHEERVQFWKEIFEYIKRHENKLDDESI